MNDGGGGRGMKNKFSRVCGDVAKWPDDRLWNSFKQLLKEGKQTKTEKDGNDKNEKIAKR